jgi:hypothetical protein
MKLLSRGYHPLEADQWDSSVTEGSTGHTWHDRLQRTQGQVRTVPGLFSRRTPRVILPRQRGWYSILPYRSSGIPSSARLRSWIFRAREAKHAVIRSGGQCEDAAKSAGSKRHKLEQK